jgi:hypothetical protein
MPTHATGLACLRSTQLEVLAEPSSVLGQPDHSDFAPGLEL